MELQQLKYFVSAAEEMNFTTAARKCFVTQTAISQQIKQLEKEWGVQLFNRKNNNHLTLTKAGEKLLQDAKEILFYANKTDYDMQQYKGPAANTFRFGYYESGFVPHLQMLLVRFIEKYPVISINSIQETEPHLLEMLKEGELDAAIGFPGDLLDAENCLERIKLKDFRYLMMTAPGLYAAPSGSEIELSADYPIKVVAESELLWKGFQRFFEDSPRCTSYVVTRCLNPNFSMFPDLYAGHFTAIIPEYMKYSSAQIANYYEIRSLNLAAPVELVWRKGKKNKNTDKMLTICQEYFEQNF